MILATKAILENAVSHQIRGVKWLAKKNTCRIAPRRRIALPKGRSKSVAGSYLQQAKTPAEFAGLLAPQTLSIFFTI